MSGRIGWWRSAIIVAMMMAVAGCSARTCSNGVPMLHGKAIVCGGCTCESYNMVPNLESVHSGVHSS
jgi:hypothetical protein